MIHGFRIDFPCRQLDDGSDYRPLLKEIQASGESHIILDVSPDKIVTLLRQASEVKMMEEYQSYIITSLDTHTLDFEELKFMRANITTMRLIDPSSYEVMNGGLGGVRTVGQILIFLSLLPQPTNIKISDSRLGAGRTTTSAQISHDARGGPHRNGSAPW
jgi:Receptor family ligand binding region